MEITATFNYDSGEWEDNRPKRTIEIIVDSVCDKIRNKENVLLIDFIQYYNFLPYETYLGFVNWLIDNNELKIKKLDLRNIRTSDYARLHACKTSKRFEIWKSMLDLFLQEKKC